ncbi:hypothetical protein [uncultured Pseudodesulfovibrio sp.]|uniref:hypothetical protein n=1 Tax=uncultured Pseudodesulfovibrio sp. TaxID=2035858 RepID=UPI0029C75D53|nr:hypothetical protein [uncultured Pseudodesulfovibrio sp.]
MEVHPSDYHAVRSCRADIKNSNSNFQIPKRRKDAFSKSPHKAHAAWALFEENRAGQLDRVPKMSGAILSERHTPEPTRHYRQPTHPPKAHQKV